MIQTNTDEALLLSQNVDLSVPMDPMHQALRIALYDEYHARATYMKVIEHFGNVYPFANIVDAENRHIEELLYLFNKYSLEPPVDDWSFKVQAEPTLVENCEVGVTAEIDNIKMYDNLIPYAYQDDVLDAFYRLQAASYNNHLEAFRRCVANSYNQNSGSFEQKRSDAFNPNDLLKSISGFKNGAPNIEALGSLFKGIGNEFIFGAAAGAVVMTLVNSKGLSNLFKETNKEGE